MRSLFAAKGVDKIEFCVDKIGGKLYYSILVSNYYFRYHKHFVFGIQSNKIEYSLYSETRYSIEN